MRRGVFLSVAILATGSCGSPAPPVEEPGPLLPPAPWAGAELPGSAVAPVYLSEWRAAENRETCAPVAPATLGEGQGATPRPATFSGGWAVAYDLPQTRSAFGIAGTGAAAADPAYSDWPNEIRWSDGSSAEYGLEGGIGPNHLAYVRIADQSCLYNVWSRLGQEHLEYLLRQLRYVAPAR